MQSMQVGPYILQVRLLTHKDKDEIIHLQQKVYDALEQPEQLQQLTLGEIEEILNQQLFAGAFYNNQLIAARAFLRPVDDPEPLAQDVEIPERHWNHVIYSEITIVDPGMQGHGLQKKMGQWWLEKLQESDVAYICSTVAPFNIASMKDKFQLGMEIAALKPKYNGKLRYIFVKRLHQQVIPEGEKQRVRMDEIEQQQHILAQGYRGIAMEEDQHIWWIHYRKNRT